MKAAIQLHIINLVSSIGLKKPAKYAFYFLGYQFSRILKKRAYSPHSITELGDGNEESFFGYFDKSPENPDGKYVTYHQTRLNTHKKPNTNGDGVDIMLVERANGSRLKIGSTQAFNWQQGARLMWLSSTELVYNIYDGEYKSVFFDINSNLSKTISKPVYDCYGSSYALTLSFERLNAFRPDYGYRCHSDQNELASLDQDGIWRIDLLNDKVNLIITLESLTKLNSKQTMDGADHWVNHIMISPDGNGFMFLHRWAHGEKRYDRLLYYDFTTDELQILSDNDSVSHCFWLDSKRIVGYMNDFDRKSKLMLLDVETGSSEEFKYSQSVDIHMNIFKDQMVFDTYPDFYRFKTLGIVDLNTRETSILGKFREPMRYYLETRCDLHSSFNYTGNRVYFDSVHAGKRKLYFIEIGT